jgi:hypothetical protein
MYSIGSQYRSCQILRSFRAPGEEVICSATTKEWAVTYSHLGDTELRFLLHNRSRALTSHAWLRVESLRRCNIDSERCRCARCMAFHSQDKVRVDEAPATGNPPPNSERPPPETTAGHTLLSEGIRVSSNHLVLVSPSLSDAGRNMDGAQGAS